MLSLSPLPPLGLYVHLPWCLRKCPYCDFNSHTLRKILPERDYIEALLRDLEQDVARVKGRSLQSIFIGGGTPSLFSAKGIDELLSGIRTLLPCVPDVEITLEANPATGDMKRFQGYREAGVNRLSIGVQSFQPDQLNALGRTHGADEALCAGVAATEAGFSNFNLDLMYGLPGQCVKSAILDLHTAISLGPTHLSLYQLTIEPNTHFYHDPPTLPNDELRWQMQCLLQAILAEAGYQQYEVSAYARHGWRCRHNLNYWEFGDYLGIGAGAHAKISDLDRIVRISKPKHPARYLATAGTPTGVLEEKHVDANDVGFEFMINALRLREGFPTSLFQSRTGRPITLVDHALADAERRGLLTETDVRVCATPLGFRFLNEVLELFLPESGNDGPRVAISRPPAKIVHAFTQ